MEKKKGMIIMKKIFSRILILAVLSTLMFSLTGCSEEKRNEQVVKELEKIYDDEFTIINSKQKGGGVFGRGSNTLLNLECKKYPGEKIEVIYDYGLFFGGNKLITCNYDSYRYNDEILRNIDFISDVYNDYCVVNEKIGTRIDKNMTFDTYKQEGIYLRIYLSPDNDINKKEENIEKLRKLLKKNKIKANIYVYYISNQKSYDEAKNKINESYTSYLKIDPSCKARGGFLINDEYEWSYYNWS